MGLVQINILKKICKRYVKYNYNLLTPPVKLCTDNGIMIANAGLERFKLGLINDLLITPSARWELEELKKC